MRQPVGTSKHKSAKTLGSTRAPAAKVARQTLHLDEMTVKRLGVHCSLVGRDRSAMANEILAGWLARYGHGRQIFNSHEEGRDPAVDVDDDRQGQRTEISLDDPDVAA
jgi:hypothetical protein